MSNKPWKTRFLLFIAIGFILGIFMGAFYKGKNDLLAPRFLGEMKDRSVDAVTCVYDVVKQRGGLAVFLLIAATTYLAPLIVAATAFWLGMSMGIFQTIAIGHYGLKGILLLPAVTLPQFLFYLPAYYFMFLWCEKLYGMIYLKKTWKRGNAIASLILILAAMASGILLECMISPKLFHAFLNVF